MLGLRSSTNHRLC